MNKKNERQWIVFKHLFETVGYVVLFLVLLKDMFKDDLTFTMIVIFSLGIYSISGIDDMISELKEFDERNGDQK